MRKAFLWYGLLGAASSLAAYFFAQYQAGWRLGLPLFGVGADADPVYIRATTMALAAIVFSQIGEVWNCRTETASVFSVGLFSNRQINIGIIFEICLIVFITLFPPFQDVFHTSPLSLTDYGFLCLLPPLILFVEEIRKAIVRKRHNQVNHSVTPQAEER
jgi:magnesium-transporting ATPase (P-type)